jgi:2-haloalkanoic acid dehalogenase type II
VSDTRWVTFDCYGTLIDWEGGIRAAMAAVWPDADPDALLHRHHAVEHLVQEGRAMPYREVLARCLEAVGAIEGRPVPADQRFALAESLPSWPAFTDVPAALSELRERGWRLAILSNTDPDLLAASVRNIGVDVDLRVTAVDAGSYKPAYGHWKRFIAESGADPSRYVHVAASLFHDIAPAAELGLPALWINRRGEISDLPRVGELRTLGGLADLLDLLVP